MDNYMAQLDGNYMFYLPTFMPIILSTLIAINWHVNLSLILFWKQLMDNYMA